MKQLLYITIAILLSACSNDNVIDNSIDSDKTYPVSFKITDASFNIDENNLRTTDDEIKLRLFTYFYKANGKIANYEERAYDLSSIGSYSYTKDLLPGKYYVAFIADKNIISAEKAAFNAPYDFHSDYYFKPNENIYYGTVEITVIENKTTTQTEVVNIKPMWSQLNIKIGDAQTFDIPEGTEALVFETKPHLAGFGIENKLASKPYPKFIYYPNFPNRKVYTNDYYDIIKTETIRQNPTFTYTTSVSKTNSDNTLGVNIRYVKLKNDTVSEVLQTRQLKIATTTVDNGFIYSIKGNLGNENSTKGFNISLGEFNKEDVVIDF